jgi:hypothetical protein
MTKVSEANSFMFNTQFRGSKERRRIGNRAFKGSLATFLFLALLATVMGRDYEKPESPARPWEVTLARDGNFYGNNLQDFSFIHGVTYRISPRTGKLFEIAPHLRVGAAKPMRIYTTWAVGALAEGGDGSLYGRMQGGGVFGLGGIFRVTPSGKLTTVYYCADYNDAWPNPEVPVVCTPEGTLYALLANGLTLLRLDRDGSDRTIELSEVTESRGLELIFNAAGELLVATMNGEFWKVNGEGTLEFFGNGRTFPASAQIAPRRKHCWDIIQPRFPTGCRRNALFSPHL